MSYEIESIHGGVTRAKGFRAAALGCDIKGSGEERTDLAVIASDRPCESVGVFTTNRVKAAPVRISAEHLRRDKVQAIIANSGNANACTGPQGADDARQMARMTAKTLKLRQRQVAVCSTGIIGLPLPIENVISRVPELCENLHERGGSEVARAIMTSDTRPKEAAVRVEIGGQVVTIGGCAKGAGMICPSMATMLCFVTTDAVISHAALQKALHMGVDLSFNRITIDGDMSTNDTVIVMANGAAGNRPIRMRSEDEKVFRKALKTVMLKLARSIVSDGERVTKFVEVQVKGAATYFDARKVAEAVAKSSLCKCSWNGGDANWGRIIDAVGYSGAKVREELIDIYFGGVAAARSGLATPTPLETLRKVVARKRFAICIDLNIGTAEHMVYTSDLSPEYVEYNRSEYAMWKRARV